MSKLSYSPKPLSAIGRTFRKSFSPMRKGKGKLILMLMLRSQGFIFKDIAARVGLDYSVVMYHCRRFGILPNVPIPKERLIEICGQTNEEYRDLKVAGENKQQQSELNKTAEEISRRKRKLITSKTPIMIRKFYNSYGRLPSENELLQFSKEYKNSFWPNNW